VGASLSFSPVWQEAEVAGPHARPVADRAVALAAGRRRLQHDLLEPLSRVRQRHSRARGGVEQPVEVRVQAVHAAVHQRGGVEHTYVRWEQALGGKLFVVPASASAGFG
jgi:hypothetical protein